MLASRERRSSRCRIARSNASAWHWSAVDRAKRRQAPEQYWMSGQLRSHFFRHVMSRPQAVQSLLGRVLGIG